MNEPDDRTINSEGAPFGPILAKMLHDEVDCVRGRPDFNDAFRIAAILNMAAGYIDAVVEGNGPANHHAPADATIAMLTKALNEAADSLSNANRPRCARKARAILGHVERGTPHPDPRRGEDGEAIAAQDPMAEYVAASLAWWLDDSDEEDGLTGPAWERFWTAYYRLPVEVRRGK